MDSITNKKGSITNKKEMDALRGDCDKCTELVGLLRRAKYDDYDGEIVDEQRKFERKNPGCFFKCEFLCTRVQTFLTERKNFNHFWALNKVNMEMLFVDETTSFESMHKAVLDAARADFAQAKSALQAP